MRPEFIPREAFRAYLTKHQLDKYARIDGIKPSGYIAKCERDGRPLSSKLRRGSKTWRLLDIVARARAYGLRIEPPHEVELVRSIADLEARKSALELEIKTRKHELAMAAISSRLTGKTLLTEAEIVAGKLELPNISAVYFLLRGDRVVYVGQSIDVFKRVSQHASQKKFDGFAYIPCEPQQLDLLESLYIHTLRPELNGEWKNATGMCAPLSLDVLLNSLTANS